MFNKKRFYTYKHTHTHPSNMSFTEDIYGIDILKFKEKVWKKSNSLKVQSGTEFLI